MQIYNTETYRSFCYAYKIFSLIAADVAGKIIPIFTYRFLGYFLIEYKKFHSIFIIHVQWGKVLVLVTYFFCKKGSQVYFFICIIHTP